MRTLTNSGMTVQAFDEACWLADTNILIVSLNVGIVADGVVLSETRGGDAIAVWSFFGRQTKLDVSELLRLKAYGAADGKVSGSMWLRLNNSDQDYDMQVTYSTQGRANPLKEWMVVHENDGLLLPPLSLLNGGTFTSTTFPILIPSAEAGTWRVETSAGTTTAITKGVLTSVTANVSANVEINVIKTDGADEVVQRSIVKPYVCGEERVQVTWTGREGTTKRAVWLKTKDTLTQIDRVSLDSLDGEYRGFAGVDEEFTLRLADLTPYDMWWYSDIISSGKVVVSRVPEPVNDDMRRAVEVETKSTTIPDGYMSNGVLEIKVKYRTYGATDL
jgi:hypothetical protein